MEKSRFTIIGFSLAALAAILIAYLDFARGARTAAGRVRAEDIGLEVGYGGVGTLIGLALALVGTVFLKAEKRVGSGD